MMTIIQQLKRIEQVIYTVEYDKLPDYLQGIRDMINLLNGDEQQERNLADTIEQEIKIIGGQYDSARN